MKAVFSALISKIVSLFRKVASLLHKVVSLVGNLVRKLWGLPPFRRIDQAFNRAWKPNRTVEYRFLPYVTSVLRVLGWAVLVIGVVAAILAGLQIMNGGLTVGTIELTGVGKGVCAILLGIAGSFLAWLFLLANRELLYLFIHVKENTRSAAESIAEESD